MPSKKIQRDETIILYEYLSHPQKIIPLLLHPFPTFIQISRRLAIFPLKQTSVVQPIYLLINLWWILARIICRWWWLIINMSPSNTNIPHYLIPICNMFTTNILQIVLLKISLKTLNMWKHLRKNPMKRWKGTKKRKTKIK